MTLQRRHDLRKNCVMCTADSGLACAWCAMLAATVTRQSNCAICFDATHETVMTTCMARLLCKIGYQLRFLFLPFLSSHFDDSIDDFGVLSPIQSMWCHKSTPLIDITIVLAAYVVLTVTFCCILNFSLE
jgi:hypothetical protein